MVVLVLTGAVVAVALGAAGGSSASLVSMLTIGIPAGSLSIAAVTENDCHLCGASGKVRDRVVRWAGVQILDPEWVQIPLLFTVDWMTQGKMLNLSASPFLFMK